MTYETQSSSPAYNLTITKKGLSECVSMDNKGLKAEIKWISAGTEMYTPTSDQFKLRNEQQRVTISQYLKETETSLQCLANFDGEQQYPVGEFGIWLSTGTLFGVISVKDELLNYKAKNGNMLVPFTLDLSVCPVDAVTVVVGPVDLNIIIDKEMMADATAFIRSQRTQTNMSLAFMKQEDRIKALETSNV